MFGGRRCSAETANGRREMNVYCNDVTIADDRARLARNKDGEGRKLQLRGDGRGGVGKEDVTGTSCVDSSSAHTSVSFSSSSSLLVTSSGCAYAALYARRSRAHRDRQKNENALYAAGARDDPDALTSAGAFCCFLFGDVIAHSRNDKSRCLSACRCPFCDSLVR